MTQLSMLNPDGSVIEMSRARAQRDDGMSRAARHAESDYPGWADVAFRFLNNFAVTHQHFISEDVSDASRAWGMVQPSTDRAWGNVYKRAIKDGVIVQDGAGRSRRRHASICPRWKSLIYREPA